MHWLFHQIVRETKRLAKWAGISFIAICVLVAVTYVMTPRMDAMRKRLAEQEQAERQAAREKWEAGWRKWWDEHQSVDNGGKQPSRKNEPEREAPPGYKNGFTAGYLTGYAQAAKQGGPNPPSADIDALARKMAQDTNVPAEERQQWASGFSTGFLFGWKEGRP